MSRLSNQQEALEIAMSELSNQQEAIELAMKIDEIYLETIKLSNFKKSIIMKHYGYKFNPNWSEDSSEYKYITL